MSGTAEGLIQTLTQQWAPIFRRVYLQSDSFEEAQADLQRLKDFVLKKRVHSLRVMSGTQAGPMAGSWPSRVLLQHALRACRTCRVLMVDSACWVAYEPLSINVSKKSTCSEATRDLWQVVKDLATVHSFLHNTPLPSEGTYHGGVHSFFSDLASVSITRQ